MLKRKTATFVPEDHVSPPKSRTYVKSTVSRLVDLQNSVDNFQLKPDSQNTSSTFSYTPTKLDSSSDYRQATLKLKSESSQSSQSSLFKPSLSTTSASLDFQPLQPLQPTKSEESSKKTIRHPLKLSSLYQKLLDTFEIVESMVCLISMREKSRDVKFSQLRKNILDTHRRTLTINDIGHIASIAPDMYNIEAFTFRETPDLRIIILPTPLLEYNFTDYVVANAIKYRKVRSAIFKARLLYFSHSYHVSFLTKILNAKSSVLSPSICSPLSAQVMRSRKRQVKLAENTIEVAKNSLDMMEKFVTSSMGPGYSKMFPNTNTNNSENTQSVKNDKKSENSEKIKTTQDISQFDSQGLPKPIFNANGHTLADTSSNSSPANINSGWLPSYVFKEKRYIKLMNDCLNICDSTYVSVVDGQEVAVYKRKTDKTPLNLTSKATISSRTPQSLNQSIQQVSVQPENIQNINTSHKNTNVSSISSQNTQVSDISQNTDVSHISGQNGKSRKQLVEDIDTDTMSSKMRSLSLSPVPSLPSKYRNPEDSTKPLRRSTRITNTNTDTNTNTNTNTRSRRKILEAKTPTSDISATSSSSSNSNDSINSSTSAHSFETSSNSSFPSVVSLPTSYDSQLLQTPSSISSDFSLNNQPGKNIIPEKIHRTSDPYFPCLPYIRLFQWHLGFNVETIPPPPGQKFSLTYSGKVSTLTALKSSIKIDEDEAVDNQNYRQTGDNKILLDDEDILYTETQATPKKGRGKSRKNTNLNNTNIPDFVEDVDGVLHPLPIPISASNTPVLTPLPSAQFPYDTPSHTPHRTPILTANLEHTTSGKTTHKTPVLTSIPPLSQTPSNTRNSQSYNTPKHTPKHISQLNPSTPRSMHAYVKDIISLSQGENKAMPSFSLSSDVPLDSLNPPPLESVHSGNGVGNSVDHQSDCNLDFASTQTPHKNNARVLSDEDTNQSFMNTPQQDKNTILNDSIFSPLAFGFNYHMDEPSSSHPSSNPLLSNSVSCDYDSESKNPLPSLSNPSSSVCSLSRVNSSISHLSQTSFNLSQSSESNFTLTTNINYNNVAKTAIDSDNSDSDSDEEYSDLASLSASVVASAISNNNNLKAYNEAQGPMKRQTLSILSNLSEFVGILRTFIYTKRNGTNKGYIPMVATTCYEHFVATNVIKGYTADLYQASVELLCTIDSANHPDGHGNCILYTKLGNRMLIRFNMSYDITVLQNSIAKVLAQQQKDYDNLCQSLNLNKLTLSRVNSSMHSQSNHDLGYMNTPSKSRPQTPSLSRHNTPLRNNSNPSLPSTPKTPKTPKSINGVLIMDSLDDSVNDDDCESEDKTHLNTSIRRNLFPEDESGSDSTSNVENTSSTGTSMTNSNTDVFTSTGTRGRNTLTNPNTENINANNENTHSIRKTRSKTSTTNTSTVITKTKSNNFSISDPSLLTEGQLPVPETRRTRSTRSMTVNSTKKQ